VRAALVKARRTDLIGDGCDCLIAAKPPRAALDERRRKADRELTERTSGDHIRGTPGREGYRPGRKTAARRRRG
jgi:hypothetical protein